MALDKVIDSAELDAGMTATANAIREKTGSTDPIVWDTSKGFKSAVEGIQTGGGGGADVARSILDKSITEYSDSDIVKIGDYGLMNCSKLSKVSLPNVTSAGKNTFEGCSTLEDVNLQNLVTVTSYTFYKCYKIKDMRLPKVTQICQAMFREAGLTSLDTSTVGSISYEAFRGASALKVLILRNSQIASLVNIQVFAASRFASGGAGGVLLVPSELAESYKTATNWSVIYGYGTNRYLALEDYTADGTTTGEIDWDKVNALFEEASA